MINYSNYISCFNIYYSQVQDEIDNLLENLQKSFDLAKVQSHAKILNAETLLNNTVVENDYNLHYDLRADKELQKEKIDSLKNAAAKKGVNIDDCLSFEKLVLYLDIKAFNESMLCTDLLVSTAQENLITKPNKVSVLSVYYSYLKYYFQIDQQRELQHRQLNIDIFENETSKFMNDILIFWHH